MNFLGLVFAASNYEWQYSGDISYYWGFIHWPRANRWTRLSNFKEKIWVMARQWKEGGVKRSCHQDVVFLLGGGGHCWWYRQTVFRLFKTNR
jgi:hypothetical protein